MSLLRPATAVVLFFCWSAAAIAQPAAPADEIRWLEERSMLRQARDAAELVSGRPEQWQHPYGKPQPLEAVRHASVWLLDYPGSVIPANGKSVVATWADPTATATRREGS